MNVTITHGLHDSQRAAAARLYWQAFGGKLGPILGPAPRAHAHLARAMQLDTCFCALQGGQLVGIVGFQGAQGSFAGGTGAQFRASYGWIRAAWGLPVLQWVGGPQAAQGALMIDGFSVDTGARGQGIGAQLLIAVAGYARAQGYRALQLDVIDANWRARAFYQSHGFTLQHSRSIGPLRWIFGFNKVQRLTRDLA